jgi:hypothetical protein
LIKKHLLMHPLYMNKFCVELNEKSNGVESVRESSQLIKLSLMISSIFQRVEMQLQLEYSIYNKIHKK